MADNGLHSGHRDRMRARFRTAGSLEGFAEHEVLEMLLFNILPRVNTNEIAHRLLQRFGNIKSVLAADITELCQVEGVGVKCAEQLVFLGDVFRRAQRESFLTVQADDFESLRSFLTGFYQGDSVERLCAFSVNAAGRITACSVISVGMTDKVSFDIKELKRFLILNNADVLLLAHNHPLGSAQPSSEDILLTRKLRGMLGSDIRLMDHIIVGSDGIVSLRALGCFRAFE